MLNLNETNHFTGLRKIQCYDFLRFLKVDLKKLNKSLCIRLYRGYYFKLRLPYLPCLAAYIQVEENLNKNNSFVETCTCMIWKNKVNGKKVKS